MLERSMIEANTTTTIPIVPVIISRMYNAINVNATIERKIRSTGPMFFFIRVILNEIICLVVCYCFSI